MADVVRVIGYALIAAASPVTLLATLVVVGSGRGRANGAMFLVGFLVGQSAVCMFALFVGSASFTGRKEHDSTVADALELAMGVLLVAVGVAGRHRRGSGTGREPSRVTALVERLRRLRPGTAFTAGGVLGVGTKRFAVTVLAAASIAAAGLQADEETGLAALYIVVASVLVWLPVGLYMLFGSRAESWILRSEAWLEANGSVLTAWISLVFGALLCADALVRLL